MNKNILMVDDDENILAAYKRNIRNNYNIITMNKPEEALKVLETIPDIAAIVSDFKMPGMNGIEFLKAAKGIRPDSVRIMLTGYADMQATIDAVNEGNIFRFLTKPCASDKLLTAIDDAVRQYELVNAEKELLNKTLKGSIKVLADILSAVNPIAFSRSMRLGELVIRLGKRLKIENLWEAEIAALLSQIGCVAIPSDILERKYNDKSLSLQESELYLKHPYFGMMLINNIPRLNNVSQAIAQQFECYNLNSDGRKKSLQLSARLLKVANDFETYVASGKTASQALFQMHKDEQWYDPEILAALDAELAGIEKNYILRTLYIQEIKEGMLLGEDIIDKNGIVLLTKGSKVSGIIKLKLMNLAEVKRLIEPLKILVPVENIK